MYLLFQETGAISQSSTEEYDEKAIYKSRAGLLESKATRRQLASWAGQGIPWRTGWALKGYLLTRLHETLTFLALQPSDFFSPSVLSQIVCECGDGGGGRGRGAK